MICNLCPRRCNAERNEKENIGGYCRQPLSPRIARAALHFWEEPVISGKNGSGTVFFSGCNLRCIYCQNSEISHLTKGKTISVKRLSEIFKELEEKGAENINLVTPTHYVDSIIEALDIYKPNIPIVYNSGGYESVDTLKMLEKYIDVYLIDYKYNDAQKAKIYSFAEDYPDVVLKALKECYKQKGKAIIENGIMKSGIIVRHLLLPQSTNDAIKIFDETVKNFNGVYFSLMSQYVPMGKALSDKILSRKITKREYEKVVNHILDSNYENCFIQELSSASKDFIPDFNCEGI